MGTPMGAAKRTQTLWALQATGVCVHPQAEVAKSDNHLSQVTITRVLHKALEFTDFSVKCFLAFSTNQAPQHLPHSHATIKNFRK